MTFDIAYFIALVLVPLVVILRRGPAWALFFSVALVYALYGLVEFINLKTIHLSSTTSDGSFRNTYYVASRFHYVMNLGLVFMMSAAVLWVQTRLNALIYRRVTKAMFWVFHLGTLGASLATLLPMPRRYIDAQTSFDTLLRITSWSTFASWLAFWGLIGLTLWSAALKLKRGY